MASASAVITTSVKRPHRADAQRNFDALLAAGREAFAQHGPTASLEEIAKNAGVGIGTLYRNFPTREQLIEAVYVEEVEMLARAASEIQQLPPDEAFDAFLRRFVEYVGTKKALIAGLNKDSPVFGDCRCVMYDAGRPILANAQAAGLVRKDVSIEDVVRLVASIAGAEFVDDDQRSLIFRVAVDGLRTSA